MADPLKEMFNQRYFERLATEIQLVWVAFSTPDFVTEVCLGLEERSLNERMRHCATVLGRLLPQDYRQAIELLKQVIPNMPKGYQNLLFPEFVAQFGLDQARFSLDALKFFTRFGSSEFAVRHFIRRDVAGTLAVMLSWAQDENEHVRRLASEGCRPRLPWSFKLDAVLENPELTRGILEALKADQSLYVRKSVANHLNDLSKDHTEYMLELVGAWDMDNAHTSWIVKHACRTLIKKGHPRALKIFKFEDEVLLKLSDFALAQTQLMLGDHLKFSFQLTSAKQGSQKLVVDYRILYCKQRGQRSGKVFKLKELSLATGETVQLAKQQLIQDLTTRKHYSGTHAIEILVNGIVRHQANFELEVP
jgi:3-methyladenine DNA glycosylase AlkC